MPKAREQCASENPDAVYVCIAAGAAGPVGGDQLTFSVDVGADSALVLADISSTVLLPGPHNEQSTMAIDIRVADGATLIWLPEPIIAADGCYHRHDVRVELDADARLLMREELLLGRHGERTGNVRQSIRVRRNGAPLYHQQLGVGPRSDGWDTPAVVGAYRTLGSMLVVDPAWRDERPQGGPLGDTLAVLPLAGPAVVVTALAADTLELRRGLNQALSRLISWAQPG
ncbi:hypothetical protein A5707_13560 [Mycobacterium kyorinense]|uniref:Urease accessory protein UreD n=1 Tax=Mycobacterium kyorinense TaxID=487514 RepID=A0A1A2ZN58_9MYCO|nr:urease accessory protein UreD [Mycobacterium kyorinense]OBI51730.1 hypothetical protein A5707_13560 [Mycobacterium kyorinense]